MQTRAFSLLEQVANIGSGYIIALLLWHYVVTPYLGIPYSLTDNLVITTMFTVVSLLRGYVWRRVGNWITITYGR